jgi:DNA segregation ATPase FtsK/SpoIIIE-like protein
MQLLVLAIDELAFYLNAPDRKQAQEFAGLLRDLLQRGRAAGIIVLAATQKPSHDIIPTSIRDLFSSRWALRCTTPQASDTILGQGWAAAGFSAATIDAANRGVGFLWHEGAEPVRLRSYYLTGEELTRLAQRAEWLRGGDGGNDDDYHQIAPPQGQWDRDGFERDDWLDPPGAA